MRPRFSLRLLLILFTLVAIFMGSGGRFIYRIKERVGRHKAALAKLEDMKANIGVATDNVLTPTPFESAVNRWIDKDAYPASSYCMIGMPLYHRLTPEQVEKEFEVVKDVAGITEMILVTKRLTINAVKLLASHEQLRYLKIECESFEPGAGLELAHLKSLESLSCCEQCNDELIVAAGSLPRQKELQIRIFPLTIAGAQALKQCHALKSIFLDAEDQEDPDPTPFLNSLAALPGVTTIYSNYISFNEEAAAALSRITTLKHIDISYCRSVPSDFLTSLANLREIDTIIITLWRRGPVHFDPSLLANCTKLRNLYFDHALITSDDLRAFRAHPALSRLIVRGDLPVSEIREFLKATPQCEITVITPTAETWGVSPKSDGSQPQGAVYRNNGGKLETREPKWNAPWSPLSDF